MSETQLHSHWCLHRYVKMWDTNTLHTNPLTATPSHMLITHLYHSIRLFLSLPVLLPQNCLTNCLPEILFFICKSDGHMDMNWFRSVYKKQKLACSSCVMSILLNGVSLCKMVPSDWAQQPFMFLRYWLTFCGETHWNCSLIISTN